MERPGRRAGARAPLPPLRARPPSPHLDRASQAVSLGSARLGLDGRCPGHAQVAEPDLAHKGNGDGNENEKIPTWSTAAVWERGLSGGSTSVGRLRWGLARAHATTDRMPPLPSPCLHAPPLPTTHQHVLNGDARGVKPLSHLAEQGQRVVFVVALLPPAQHRGTRVGKGA